MATYCFLLGRMPLISLAELFNRQAFLRSDLTITDLTSQSLIVSSEQPFNPSEWQKALGGTVKIGQVVAEFKSIQELTESVAAGSLRPLLFSQGQQKIVFGFSLYGEIFRKREKEFNKLGLHIKNELKNSGLKSRFVQTSDETFLTSVQVTKNKLIERGADIIIISGLHALYVAKALAVQEFEEYSFRDYGRPQRDSHSGMLPPKLAKIMINLAQASPAATLLDPFCGSGTVLQEALLQGYTQLTGSDISEKAIADTRQNLSWLATNYKFTNARTELLLSDIKKLDKKIKPQTIDSIVTEPYLGPAIGANITIVNMLAIIQELETLYLNAFNIFAKIIKPSGRIVIIFPLFKTGNGIFSLNILERLQKMGFIRQNPFPESVSLFAKIGPTARGSLVYSRPDQKVEREIFIFQHKKSGQKP